MHEAIHWKRLGNLGEGGQSSVYLVRSQERQQELARASEAVESFSNGTTTPFDFAAAISSLARSDEPKDLGALKVFDKTHESDAQTTQRLEREIEILKAGYTGLPKLLDANGPERWLVTEYFPRGALERNFAEFKGNARKSLHAFRLLVETVAHLHSKGIVHRDIKPANIFLSNAGTLILGDFGIAHRVDVSDRFTFTNERVGPRDFMPPWADTGERLDAVSPSFDVYMLGKLLWCMVAGKSKLPREYHRRPEYDVTSMFPEDPEMYAVNILLDRMVVEQQDKCPSNASTLLRSVDTVVNAQGKGFRYGPEGELRYPCVICHNGYYVEQDTTKKLSIGEFNEGGGQTGGMSIRHFACNICTHRAFFTPQFPDAAARWGFVEM